jgi:hypothetical protein
MTKRIKELAMNPPYYSMHPWLHPIYFNKKCHSTYN